MAHDENSPEYPEMVTNSMTLCDIDRSACGSVFSLARPFTDTMTRFLVPVLISGMILTVRTIYPSLLLIIHLFS